MAAVLFSEHLTIDLAKTTVVVAAGGLLDDAVYGSLSQCIGPERRLQPLPRDMDASQITSAAIKAFLASPSRLGVRVRAE